MPHVEIRGLMVRAALFAALALSVGVLSACGSAEGKKSAGGATKASTKKSSGVKERAKASAKPSLKNGIAAEGSAAEDRAREPVKKPPQRLPDGPKLVDLLNQVGAEGEKTAFDKAAIPVPALPPLDEDKAAAHGIRKVSGKILTLYTDLPTDREVDELPQVFEQAIPQWCAYFGLDAAKAANWKPRAFLMKDKEKFLESGLLPRDLPPFLNGYQRESELFFYEQPSAFYRRHLLLHEGTHGFMNVLLGGAGPPWFMEGTAELFGTHLWQNGQLTLAYVPKNKEESPYWGRVKTIKDETAANRAQTLQEIFAYDTRAHLKPEPYAWCWGACSFLDRHPLTQTAFREMQRELRDTSPRFSAVFHDKIKEDWAKVVEEWQLFVLEQEYGYDVPRAAIVYRAGKPLAAGNDSAQIAADRGWQSSGIRLEAGAVYQLTSEGRYQVGNKPKPWWCEPGGVTVHYHRGRPLGMLLAAVRSDEGHARELTPLAKPFPVGLAANYSPEISGTLYLKINESAAGLGDNQGSLLVRVSAK
jgi:hypothetical protein